MPKTPLVGAPEPIAALNRVRMTETHLPLSEWEPLVDVREYCPEVSFTAPLCPYLRKTVADRLNQAQASLQDGMRLRGHTALRTLSMQKRGWDNYYKRMQEEHPNWPLSALRRATNRYYAPYDQKAPPGHCTGGAIDVNLLDKEGNDLDLIAPTTGWEAAYTWSDKLSPEAHKNRMIMVNAMLGAGFSNCREEYWHYSWGDSGWAVRVGEKECPYGWIHPPVCLEPDSDSLSPSQLSLSYDTDALGRAICAEGHFELKSDNKEWRIGLLWANGIPVTLHLHLPFAQRETPPLFLGENKENWQPLSEFEREGQTVILRLTPEADRLFLANFSPEPANPIP